MRVLWTNHIRRRGHRNLDLLKNFWAAPIESNTVSISNDGTRSSSAKSELIWGDSLLNAANFSPNYSSQIQLRLEHHWQRYIALNGWGISMAKTPDFYALVKRGIPDRLRGTFWMYASGALNKLLGEESDENHFRTLLERNAGRATQAVHVRNQPP